MFIDYKIPKQKIENGRRIITIRIYQGDYQNIFNEVTKTSRETYVRSGKVQELEYDFDENVSQQDIINFCNQRLKTLTVYGLPIKEQE